MYDTVGGVELGRNSLKCLQFGGRLTILAERLFNSERSSSVLPCTVICNLCIDLTVKDQVCSQVLHRGLDLDTNGRRWSWSWGRPCHCQHSSHQSYHDESRPLQSWFVIFNLFLSYSGCSSSGVSSGYPYTPAAQHKRGKVRSWSLVFKFLKHLKRNFLALIFSVDPNTVFLGWRRSYPWSRTDSSVHTCLIPSHLKRQIPQPPKKRTILPFNQLMTNGKRVRFSNPLFWEAEVLILYYLF